MSLYKKHRPKKLTEVIGQDSAIKQLQGFIKSKKMPHCLLFSGGSGCGKTTLARIIARGLKCSKQDFQEINAADFKGIDTIRDIRSRMSLAPIGGRCRVWLMDECHQLSTPAQDSLLKMLEDTPEHVYFMLATTLPEKLLKTIRGRATEIRVKDLGPSDLESVLTTVCEKEGVEVPEEVREKITELSEGSARKSLVLLEQTLQIEDAEDQLAALQSADLKPKAIELARALISPKANWKKIAETLKGLDDDPESLRRMILGYASSVMLGGGRLSGQAFLLATAFADPFYNTGKPGLVAACYEVVNGG